jgi:predicted nucleotidyltransferase
MTALLLHQDFDLKKYMQVIHTIDHNLNDFLKKAKEHMENLDNIMGNDIDVMKYVKIRYTLCMVDITEKIDENKQPIIHRTTSELATIPLQIIDNEYHDDITKHGLYMSLLDFCATKVLPEALMKKGFHYFVPEFPPTFEFHIAGDESDEENKEEDETYIDLHYYFNESLYKGMFKDYNPSEKKFTVNLPNDEKARYYLASLYKYHYKIQPPFEHELVSVEKSKNEIE